MLGTFGSQDHNNSHVTPPAVHVFTVWTGHAHCVLSQKIYMMLLLYTNTSNYINTFYLSADFVISWLYYVYMWKRALVACKVYEELWQWHSSQDSNKQISFTFFPLSKKKERLNNFFVVSWRCQTCHLTWNQMVQFSVSVPLWVEKKLYK